MKKIYTMVSILLILVVLFFYIIPSKKDFEVKDVKGVLCLIIDDFGHSNNQLVSDFLFMPPDFTIAVIPGLSYSTYLSNYSDSLGFENIVHMPMEAFNQDMYNDHPYLLSSSLNEIEVENRISNAFIEVPKAIGMNNHQGSKATENLQLMKYVARSLKKKDKYFLDSFTNPESRGFITMRRYGVKTELRQVFLDHIETVDHVQAQLDSLVMLSHAMGVAIGIGHVKPITLEVLKREIPRLKSLGYEFVKLSTIVR
tara:strand:+ start:1532 stop:2296 length:765 start_codon:yes stop_codon:yes gene_type:complete